MKKRTDLSEHLDAIRPAMTSGRARAMNQRSSQARRLERISTKIVWPKQREVTLAEAAVLLPYTELSIRRMIHRGELRATSVAYNDIRISVAELKRWVRAQLEAATATTTPEQARRLLEQLTRRMGL